MKAFNMYVRPCLEYNSVNVSPATKQDKLGIEKVQRSIHETPA